MRRLGILAAAVVGACGKDSNGTTSPVVKDVALVATVPIPQFYGIHDTYVRDGLAFVCAWDSGVILFDVGNGIRSGTPAVPVRVSQIVTAGGEVHNAWWFHNPTTGEKKYLFVGQEGPGSIGASASGDIHVVDVSDLTHPLEVGAYHLDGAGTHNFWVDEPNQILYAAYYDSGVVAIDIKGTLPANLAQREISHLVPGGVGDTYTWGVQLYNGSLYASDMLAGLWQLTTASGALSIAGGGNNVTERFTSDLWVANGYAYTGTWGRRAALGNAVKIWRLNASGAPVLVDSIITSGITTVSDIEVSADNKLLMFSAEGGPGSGFYFYGLTDPAHPTFLTSYPVVSPGIHTATFGTILGRKYAFGAKDPAGAALVILDVTSLDP